MAGVFNINVHYYSEHRRRTCWWSWQASEKEGHPWRVSITADYIPREELNVLDTSDMFTFSQEKLNEWKAVCDGKAD